MFKTKQGSAWTLHFECVMSLSELPDSSKYCSLSSRLQESSLNHKLGPSRLHWSWTGGKTKELEREKSHFRVTVAADVWPGTGAHLPSFCFAQSSLSLTKFSLLSRLGLSAHEMLFTMLECLLRAQPLQCVVSDRMCCFPSHFQDFATEDLYWNVACDRVVPMLACNNLTAANQSGSSTFIPESEGSSCSAGSVSIISTQDKSVLEVVSSSEMEHYLSFHWASFHFCSVPLLLSARCLVLRHILLARGGWHHWVPAACLDLVSRFPLFAGILTKELEIGMWKMLL